MIEPSSQSGKLNVLFLLWSVCISDADRSKHTNTSDQPREYMIVLLMARSTRAAAFFCTRLWLWQRRRRRKQAQSRRLLLCDRHTHTHKHRLPSMARCSHRIEIINQIKIFHFQMICGAVCLFLFLLCVRERITLAVLFNWMPDCVSACFLCVCVRMRIYVGLADVLMINSVIEWIVSIGFSCAVGRGGSIQAGRGCSGIGLLGSVRICWRNDWFILFGLDDLDDLIVDLECHDRKDLKTSASGLVLLRVKFNNSILFAY